MRERSYKGGKGQNMIFGKENLPAMTEGRNFRDPLYLDSLRIGLSSLEYGC
jgi:hypothetical protein